MAIEEDGRVGIAHIGVYAALLQYWKERGYENPIRVFSREIMEIAKISTSRTYRKCIRDLCEYGYIRYIPSFKRTFGSKIYFLIGESLKKPG